MTDFDRTWWKENQTGCALMLILLVLVLFLFGGCAVMLAGAGLGA